MKKIFILLFIIIVAVVLFLKQSSYFQKPFLYAGTLEATKIDISARLSSAISDITANEGDIVKKGEVLIIFSCEDVKIANTLAQDNYNRYSRLLKPGFVSPEQYEEYKSKKEDAATRLEWCKLTSPTDGKVLDRYHEPGEWVSPGMKILTLADTKDVYAYIYVPQPYIAKLKLGMKVQAILPELNNRIFEGVIIKINEEAEFTPKNVQTRTERERLVYGIKIDFKNANQEEILKPGMTIEVKLQNDH